MTYEMAKTFNYPKDWEVDCEARTVSIRGLGLGLATPIDVRWHEGDDGGWG